MTRPSHSYRRGAEKKMMEKTERVRQIETDLGKKGVRVERLATFLLPNSDDQLIGELDDSYGVLDKVYGDFKTILETHRFIKVLQPKRFLRIQQVTQAGALSII